MLFSLIHHGVFAFAAVVEEDFYTYPLLNRNVVKEYAVAKVLEVNETLKNTQLGAYRRQLLTVRVLTGSQKGRIFVVPNYLSGRPDYDVVVKKGMKVILWLEYERGEKEPTNLYVSSYYREGTLTFLLVLLVILTLVIGGIVGLKAILSLGFIIASIVFVLLPGVFFLRDWKIILLTLAIGVAGSALTYILVAGFSKKALASFLGSLGGMLSAVLVGLLSVHMAHLTGLARTEEKMLRFLEPDLNFQAILISSFIIGTLGAVMDIAMSISSSVEEVKKANPAFGFADLLRSAFKVGRDVWGTMLNTLILAYVAEALPITLIYVDVRVSLLRSVNFEAIAVELIRALLGGLGMVMTIPITAFFASYLFSKDSGRELKKMVM